MLCHRKYQSLNKPCSGRHGGGPSRASIFGKRGGGGGGGGGWERCGSYENNRDTVEFSRKNGFRVNKTISKVKMFE